MRPNFRHMLPKKDYRRQRTFVLVLGLILIGLSICLTSNIWLSKTDLTKINGTLRSARTNISWAFTKSIRNPNQILKSHKSELIFKLNEYNQEYYLTENVGEHYVDDKYEAILKGLRNADTVSVWIKKNEENVFQPHIFQIDSDQKTLLEFSHLHLKNNLTAIFIFIIGILNILLYILVLIRDKNTSK